jgi:hypothetical protein
MSEKIHCDIPGFYEFYCPGCKRVHAIPTSLFNPIGGYRGPTWNFNLDFVNPTITPSIRNTRTINGKKEVCHLIMTDGHIKYCSDSTHELSDQTIEMEPFKY